MARTTLLATFTIARRLNYTIDQIREHFDVVNGDIFVLKDVDSPFRRVLTYNVVKEDRNKSDARQLMRNTISLHRKKETNTLYTLNALNQLVREQNGGQLSESFTVNWSDFDNCILLTHKEKELTELQRIDTVLVRTVNLEQWEKQE